MNALPEGLKASFLELIDLRTDRCDDQNSAFFDIGFEHGRAEGLAIGRISRRLSSQPRALAEEVRERVVQERLPKEQVLLALVECIWAIGG